MATKFQFKVLNGADASAQYAAITPKDAMTFYLLNNGLGYLGETALFGGSSQQTVVMSNTSIASAIIGKIYILSNVTSTVGGAPNDILTGMYSYNGTTMVSYSDTLIANYISDILVTDMVNGFTPDNNTVATTKAIFDFVADKLNDSSLINAAFFKAVTSHTVTQAEVDDALENPTTSPYVGIPVGDVGLLFAADIDGEAGGESWYYISLQNYVTIYNAANTNTINMSLDTDNNTFTAALNIKADEASLLVDGANGVYIKKATAIDDVTPSAANLVSESVLVDYIQNQVMTAVQSAIDTALLDVVTYTVDPVV